MLLPADNLSVDEIAEYYNDARSALIFYFDNPAQDIARFSAAAPDEIVRDRFDRLAELELSQCLTVLAAIEAMFRIDFERRCKLKKSRPLVREFRELKKRQNARISLKDDILSAWEASGQLAGSLVNKLRGALQLRHWLAHGRYWTAKVGQQYTLEYLVDLADAFAKSGKLLL